jgi:hypothetical protein
MMQLQNVSAMAIRSRCLNVGLSSSGWHTGLGFSAVDVGNIGGAVGFNRGSAICVALFFVDASPKTVVDRIAVGHAEGVGRAVNLSRTTGQAAVGTLEVD